MMGIPRGETPETCTAGAGTLLLEFGLLSKLTGDPTFLVIHYNYYYTFAKESFCFSMLREEQSLSCGGGGLQFR